jgi:hypothetical protein
MNMIKNVEKYYYYVCTTALRNVMNFFNKKLFFTNKCGSFQSLLLLLLFS